MNYETSSIIEVIIKLLIIAIRILSNTPKKYVKIYFESKYSSLHSPVFPAFLLDDSVGRTVSELWWMNQEFSPVDKILPWFSMLIYHLGDEQEAS
jgi:hypothetical protein